MSCVLALLIASSCKKFLNVRPDTNNISPATITDFQEILNNDSLSLCNFILADLSSDDVSMTDAMLAADTASYYAHTYRWGPNIWNPGDADFMYNAAYTRILQMNIVLTRIDGIEASAAQKDNVRAQALINRAWYYLTLANLYGQDYSPATAGTDLAVPLALQPDANRLPSRNTVQQVYNQVLQDLTDAVASPNLPPMGANIVHPGKAAGYALLARTYLYMGNYTQALDDANASLALNNSLVNYNTGYTMAGSLIDLQKNPETLLGRLAIDMRFAIKYGSGTFFMAPGLGALLDSNDLRLLKNFNNGNSYNAGANIITQVFNYSVGVPEVLLTKAECLARLGNGTAAMALVNQLRQNRLVNYQPLTDTTNALMAVLQERRRELFYHGGLRLFDLKRLNRDSRFSQTLQRLSTTTGTVLATLAPNDPRYVMSFSPLIIANNPNIVQNGR